MTYEEFRDELLEQIVQKSEWGITAGNVRFYNEGYTAPDDPEDLDFIRSSNMRYHNTESDVLVGDYMLLDVGDKNKPHNQCRFELCKFYEYFQKEGWDSVWGIIKKNINLCYEVQSTGVLGSIENYEAVKERLIIRPINYADNKHGLKDAVYKKTGDIALVLYVILYDNEQDLGTSKIPQLAFETWNKPFDEVWDAAIANTYIIAPPRMYMTAIDCYKPPYEKGAFMAVGSKMKSFGKLQIPVVTTVKQINGATAMFYPGVKERIAQMAGGSFYVAFTSMHEAKIHCYKTIPPHIIRKNVRDLNKNFNKKEEVLTNKVYFYDAKKKTFEVI